MNQRIEEGSPGDGSLERQHSEKVGAPPTHPLSQLVLRQAGQSALSFRELPRGLRKPLLPSAKKRGREVPEFT